MGGSPPELFEQVSGAALADLLLACRDRPLREVFPRRRAEELAGLVTAYYARLPAPEYPATALVPHVYDSELGYSGVYEWPPPDRTVPSFAHVRHTLLYAHAVEAYDLLPRALRYYVRDGDLDELFLLRALNFWNDIRQLHADGIVRMLPTDRWETFSLVDQVHEALKRPEFQKDLLDFAPAAWDDFALRTKFGDREPAERTRLLVDFYDDEVAEGDLWFVTDVQRALGVAQVTGAAIWFPSTRHMDYLRMLSRHEFVLPPVRRPGATQTTAELLALRLPGIAKLDVGTLTSLRRSSEVFEDWRAELSSALAILAENGDFAVADRIQDVRTHLDGVADRLRSQLRKERATVITGGLRDLSVTMIGAAAAGSLLGGGMAAVGSAGVAAAASRGSDLAISIAKQSKERAAIRAAHRIAVAISEDLG